MIYKNKSDGDLKFNWII